jgi:uncharacterized membrane protein HdeD (DUF308 family)
VSPRQTQVHAASREATLPYWPVPLARAVAALAVGLAVTFLADHSPYVGLLALGGLALFAGLVIVVLGRGRVADATTARVLAAQGGISAVFGAVSIAVAFTGAGLGSLLLIATMFAVLTGGLELYAGIRSREAASRDWTTVGAGTLVLALVLLIAPLDSVAAVGFIGAYAVLLGVYLTIAALSLKWSANTIDPAASGSPHSSTGATP